MESATSTTAAPARVLFADGLGQRHLTTAPGGERVDVLVVSDDLTSVPSFEATLRSVPTQLASFHHASFSRVRGLVRLGKGHRLGIVSDHVDGTRLAELLARAEQDMVPLPFDAAMHVLRVVVTGVTALHESAGGTSHGAIAPERILIGRDAKVVVADYVLGGALEQLRFSPERHWTDLRIALPATIGHPRFDERADLVQLGTLAVALILGRPLRDDENPTSNAGLLDHLRMVSASGHMAPLPAGVRTWVTRALQLVPHSFTSCREALVDLESQSGLPIDAAANTAFAAFLASRSAAVTGRDAAGDGPVVTATETLAPAVVDAESTFATADDEPESRLAACVRTVRQRSRALAIGGAALIVMSLAGVAAHRYASAPGAVTATGTLSVESDPAGSAVVVDGRDRGVTPLTLTLTAGDHVMVLGSDSTARTVPLKIVGGAQVTQFYALPHASPLTGRLDVRSEPSGARVSVDGQARGVAPMTVAELVPGIHVVTIENDLGTVREEVHIEPGATAVLVAPLTSTNTAPTSGWIAVDAPAEVQLFEGERLLGTSRSDRIMLPVGRHALVIRNDALGYQVTRSVQVAGGQVARIKLAWPTGSLALNAQPWADVWIDGQHVGETPIGDASLPIGSHDVVFRHPDLGEQRYNATVTVGVTTRLSADLRKK
jgi:hypothetical protein